jgi:hypothetical protein
MWVGALRLGSYYPNDKRIRHAWNRKLDMLKGFHILRYFTRRMSRPAMVQKVLLPRQKSLWIAFCHNIVIWTLLLH